MIRATLKLKIKELDGLKPDGNQEQLAAILNKAGAVIVAQMPRVPNLIAREEVAQEQPQPPPALERSLRRGKRQHGGDQSEFADSSGSADLAAIRISDHGGAPGMAVRCSTSRERIWIRRIVRLRRMGSALDRSG